MIFTSVWRAAPGPPVLHAWRSPGLEGSKVVHDVGAQAARLADGELVALRDRLREVGTQLRARATEYERKRDPRAICSYCLGEMQFRLADRLASAADPPFEDPAWVVDLAEQLHGRFLAACAAYDTGEHQQVPRPYQQVFGALLGRRKCTILENLVFPLAAHINYDLPQALLDVKFQEKPEHLTDFHAINDLLAQAIRPIVRDVRRRYDPPLLPLVRILDHLGGAFDELLTDVGFRLTRGLAWYEASRLLDPNQHTAALAEIEGIPWQVIKGVQTPPLSMPLRSFYRFTRHLFASLPLNWPAR